MNATPLRVDILSQPEGTITQTLTEDRGLTICVHLAHKPGLADRLCMGLLIFAALYLVLEVAAALLRGTPQRVVDPAADPEPMSLSAAPTGGATRNLAVAG